MIQPFLYQDGTGSQPNGVDIGDSKVSGVMGVAMAVTNVFKNVMGAFGVEVTVQADCALPPHVEAANQQHARNTQRAQAFHLAKSHGESIGWRF